MGWDWDWVGYLLGPTLRAPYGANNIQKRMVANVRRENSCYLFIGGQWSEWANALQ